MTLGVWQATIVDQRGNVRPGVLITVRDEAIGSPLSTLYADRDGTTPLSNPFAADGDGFARFYAADGTYRIEAGSGLMVWRDVPVFATISGGGGATVEQARDYIVAQANTWAEDQTFTGALNKVTLTPPATGATLTLADGKTLTANNSLTLSGTDATTMTFPATSTTVAGLGVAQTFTAKQTIDLSGEQLALGGTNTGVMSFAGSSSGKVTVQAANAAGTYTLTLPTSDGDAGQFLKTDGSGVLSWDAAGGTPGGSDTQIQFNDGGAFGGDSGLTFNKTTKALSLSSATNASALAVTGFSLTGSNAQSLFDLAGTWNTTGTPTALKLNVTDTASNAARLLMDLQLGGASRFSVSKAGVVGVPAGGANGSTGFSIGGYIALTQVTSAFSLLAPAGAIAFGQVGATTAFGLTTYLGGLSTANPFLSFSAAGSATPDVFLARRAAANLRLGAADAAAPVAQTLSVQSVVAGTPDTAGANFTITGSQGTGTGAGGSIIFQVAPAGSSGTSQNALATALTIGSTRLATFATSVAAGSVAAIGTGLPAVSFPMSGSYSVGIYCPSDYKIAFSMSSAGPGGVAADAYTGLQYLMTNGTLSWGIVSQDIFLARDAANTLALRNGTNAQESRVYGSYTNATNFQRLSIKTLRESSGALSGASYTTTIAIPAYAVPVGVTTRVTTAVTGATTYDVGDGTDVDLWGAAIAVALGSQSRTADFTAIAAVDAAATARTVTLTANGSNFTGGVVEICLHYLTTEAD